MLLYSKYWDNVDPLAHIIHRPSFEAECRKYWVNGQVIDTAPVSFKALLAAMCLAAAVSLPRVQEKHISGINLQTIVGRLKMATEKSLNDANFMNSANIQTLQAFTIYLVSSNSINQEKCIYLTYSRSLSVVLKSQGRMRSMSERLSVWQ